MGTGETKSVVVAPGIPQRALPLLVGLFAVHLAINVFFNPTAKSYPGDFNLSQVAALGAVGFVVTQPVLLALVAAYAPLRPTVRIMVTFALMILLACALIWGTRQSGRGVTNGMESGMLALEYCIVLLVAAGWGRLRRWRIVPRPADGGLRGRQFSMRALFIAITGLSLVFAACYWTIPLARWPVGGAWERFVLEMSVAALVLSAVSLPLFCAAALILAERRRLALWFATAVSLVAGVVLFPPFLRWLIRAPEPDRDVIVFVCAHVRLGNYHSVHRSGLWFSPATRVNHGNASGLTNGDPMPRRTVKDVSQRDAMLEADLAEVEQHLAAGHRDQAERMLQSVEANMRIFFRRGNTDLLLRRLGSIYWELGFAAMAGR